MKCCTVLLCLLALSCSAQSLQEDGFLEFYLSYEDKAATALSKEEEEELLVYVYDLFLSPEVSIDLLRCGASYEAEETMLARLAYFEQLRTEYQLADSTTHINMVSSRFDDEPRADVRVRFADPIFRKRVARTERLYTHPEGWRVQCFTEDVMFFRQTHVALLDSPEEFEQLNVLTSDEDGRRLEILAIGSVRFARDTVVSQPVKFQLPLHGMDAVGCREYLLMTSDEHTFLADHGKASVKRDDGVMVWKIDASRSGTYVIARPATDTSKATFTAPEGYAIISGKAFGHAPYLLNYADIGLNQLTATFSSLPNPEHVYCEFVLCDMAGNRVTTPRMSAADLMNESLLSYFKRNDHVLPVVASDRK